MEMSARMRIVWRVLCLACALLVAAGCIVALFLPFPSLYGRAGRVLCVWEDGTTVWESYAAASAAVCGTEPQRILLRRDDIGGYTEAGETYGRVIARFEGAQLADLLGETWELAPIERAALWKSYGDTLWYDGGTFAWDGTEVRLTQREHAARVILLSGAFEGDMLSHSGATVLSLRAQSQPCAADFVGSAVQTILCEAPYYMQGGALCKGTAGGDRLIAALPAARELSVSDVRYADRGALLACTQLERLTLPFVGSALSDAGSAYDGHLGYLFSEEDGEPYRFPETLKTLCVTGGTLSADALYGMTALETLDLCGVPQENITVQAFSLLPSLKVLHTAAVWQGQGFAVRTLACGCYEYVRSDDLMEL